MLCVEELQTSPFPLRDAPAIQPPTRHLLSFAGTTMRLLEVITFCFGGQKALVFLGLVFGGLSYLVNVASSSIISKHTAYHEQVPPK